MKQTVFYNDFYNAFMCVRPDNFSGEGLYALFEYLTDLEDELGVEYELDIIALCCEYTEYPTIKDVTEDYPDITTIEQLQDVTDVIVYDEGLIILNF